MTPRAWLVLSFNVACIALASLLLISRVYLYAAVVAPTGNGTWLRPGPWVDWQTYANAFDRMAMGLGIYAPDQLSGSYQLTHMVLVGYAYPPASVPLFGLFATNPFGLAAWVALNIGLLFTAFWALISRGWPQHRMLILAIVITGLAFYQPFLDGMVSANFNVGLAGVIGWIAVGVSPAWLGIVGAMGAVTKVFPAAIAAAGSRQKKRSIAIGVVVTAALCVVTLPLVGSGSWSDFARALSNAVPDCSAQNLSIACLLSPTFGVTAGTAVGLLVGGLAAVALLLVRGTFRMALIASVAIMAPVTNLHLHYWIIAFVLVVAGVSRFNELSRPVRSELAST